VAYALLDVTKIINLGCDFREQRSVNITCMELCHLWEIVFSP